MHDLKSIREAAAEFDRGLARRGLQPQSASILALDADRRAAQTELQEIQTKRNELSRGIGIAKSKGEPVEAIMAEVAAMKERMATLGADDRRIGEELDGLLASLPNLPAPEVPDGADEHGNVELRRWGSPRNFSFEPKQHFDLGEALGLMDFGRAAKIAGARFTVLKGALARMERALGAFMLDNHTLEFDYTEVIPPALVNDA